MSNTLTTLAAIVKEMYPADSVGHTLLEGSALYAELSKDWNAEGEPIRMATRYASGAGSASTFAAAQATIGSIALAKWQLTTVDVPDKIVFLTNLMLTPLSLVPALVVWTWPPPEAILPVLGLGFTAVLGHIALVRGYAATDASLAMTFEFSRLPFSVAIAYFAFGDGIDHAG